MAEFFLHAIAYEHGERRLIRDLDETGSADPHLTEDGLEAFRQTSESAVDMACRAASRTLALSDAAPSAVIYATETAEPAGTRKTNVRIASAVGAETSVVLTAGGHGCANLGLLLMMAESMFAASDLASILLITADRAVGSKRMMASSVSALSDGAAAVLASRDRPAGANGAGPVLRISGSAAQHDWNGETGDGSMAAQRRQVRSARSAVDKLRQVTGRRPSDFTHVLFNNYRLSSQRFLAAAAGFSTEQVRYGRVAEHAHTFAADLLVNCALLAGDGAIKPGDRLALSPTGPHSWAVIDAEVVG